MASATATMKLYAGVEGGATNTVAVIMDEHAKVLAREHGPGINAYLEGIPKVADTLLELFARARASAGLPADARFESLGVCSSGFLQKGPQEELKAALTDKAPGVFGSYFVANDAPGTVYTATGSAGGMVIICGTGSMALLMDASGETYTCGGWGHGFGDEASGYYIGSKAVRKIFRALEGYTTDTVKKPVPDVTTAHALMLEYFKVSTKDGMLDVFYKSFEKARIAGFTKVLAAAAREGDAFSRSLFDQAGTHLGSQARTLAAHLVRSGTAATATSTSTSSSGAPVSAPAAVVPPFSIVCVGSVWKSWDLLQQAFIAAVTQPATPEGHVVNSFQLLQVKETSAVGAAWKAAAEAGVSLPVDFAANTERLFAFTA